MFHPVEYWICCSTQRHGSHFKVVDRYVRYILVLVPLVRYMLSFFWFVTLLSFYIFCCIFLFLFRPAFSCLDRISLWIMLFWPWVNFAWLTFVFGSCFVYMCVPLFLNLPVSLTVFLFFYVLAFLHPLFGIVSLFVLNVILSL